MRRAIRCLLLYNEVTLESPSGWGLVARGPNRGTRGLEVSVPPPGPGGGERESITNHQSSMSESIMPT